MKIWKTSRITLWMIAACMFLSLPAMAADYTAGLQIGQNAGLGGQLQLGVDNFLQTLPASLRVTAGYVQRDPGDPLAARSIFINDNTNGTPDESGSLWVFGMDAVVPVWKFGLQPVNLFFGPRYSRFTGEFEFIGGNEIFEITNREWGWGLGLESRFAITDRAGLLVSGGFDYYLDAKISGHDTTYDPDGIDVNSRNDYTFDDADDAVNTTKWEPRLLLGLTWRL